jgi:hypothetical protein
VFKHGSVVFFNVDEAMQSKYLHGTMRHCGKRSQSSAWCRHLDTKVLRAF